MGESSKSGLSNDSKGASPYGPGLATASSTATTWNETFSSTWSSDSDIDLERYNNFMKQATRPRWDGGMQRLAFSRSQSQRVRAVGDGEQCEASDNIDQLMNKSLESLDV